MAGQLPFLVQPFEGDHGRAHLRVAPCTRVHSREADSYFIIPLAFELLWLACLVL